MKRIAFEVGTAGLRPLAAALGEARRFFSLLRRFAPHIRPQTSRLLLASAAAVGYTLVTLVEPWPLQVLFDGVLLRRPVRFFGVDLAAAAGGDYLVLLLGAAAAVLLFAALRGQLYYAQNVLAASAGQEVVQAIRRDLFHHLQVLPLSYHRRARAGDILMRLTGDIAMLREMVVTASVSLLSQALLLAGVLTVMSALDVRLTLVALALVPVLFLVLSSFRVRLVEASQRQRKKEGVLASRSQEVLQSIHLVKANTAEKHEDERFKEISRSSFRAGLRSTRLEARLHRTVQIVLAAGTGAVLWLGGRDVLAGRLSPGELLVFLAYLRGLYQPLRQTSKTVQRMAKASACADRVLEVLDEEPEVRDQPDAVVLRGIRGRLEMRGVSFSYGDGRPALQDVDLAVAPRETVALVGPTGSGKTTLLLLIPRFFDPQAGEVLLDGIPLSRVRLKSLRRHVSLLSQEAVVLGVTVRENIAYGAIGGKGPTSTLRDIEAVARAAGAHEFIERLPQGYDTVVGERGATLSGGQRQRIAIARAFLRQAPILLLDEPMTGLDPLTEHAVLEALETLRRGRTTLFVAHHMSTVTVADRIVFLSGGRIVEQGPHAELLARGGRYAEFVHTQWGGLAGRGPGSAAAGDGIDVPGEAGSPGRPERAALRSRATDAAAP